MKVKRKVSEKDERGSDEPRLHQVPGEQQEQGDGGGRRDSLRGRRVQRGEDHGDPGHQLHDLETRIGGS